MFAQVIFMDVGRIVFAVGVALVVGLTAVDAVSTYIGVQQLGLIETNPITAWFMQSFGNFRGLMLRILLVNMPSYIAIFWICRRFHAFLSREMPKISLYSFFPVYALALGLAPSLSNWRFII